MFKPTVQRSARKVHEAYRFPCLEVILASSHEDRLRSTISLVERYSRNVYELGHRQACKGTHEVTIVAEDMGLALKRYGKAAHLSSMHGSREHGPLSHSTQLVTGRHACVYSLLLQSSSS